MTDVSGARTSRSILALCTAAFCAFVAAATVRAQPYGMGTRPSVGAFMNGALPTGVSSGPSAFQAVNAFPNLTFDTPTFLLPEPGSNRLIIGSDRGIIWAIDDSSNASSKAVFLDLSAHTQPFNGTGLMGMAFHPDYGKAGSPNRGYVYIYYQYTPGPVVGSRENPPDNHTANSYNRLSRFTVPDGSNTVDPNSELVLINQYDYDLWHPGGGMFFGTDGFLYLSIGDEGGNADEYDQSQRTDLGLFGGVLRIDVDRNAARSHPIRRVAQAAGDPPAGWPRTFSDNYYIPNDNPFVDPTGAKLEEFWSIGLRSPHRMTFDPVTGQIWLGDVGNASYEEVDLIQKGANYQWPWREGDHPGVKPQPASILGVSTSPVYDYPHDKGNNCVIVGYVYRGSQFSEQLGGRLIFGDNISNRIWMLTYSGSSPTVTEIATLPPGVEYVGGLSTFGFDHRNELYMCTTGSTAKIYKLQLSDSSGTAMPALLSQTGIFSNTANLAPASGLTAYTVNVPIWSDGAVKTRWMAVPNGTQIGYADTGEWSFPAGTVFVKHFELPVDDRNAAVTRRIETRILVRDNSGGVYGGTYRWRADNSDADLVPGGLSEDISITTASGGTRTQRWTYPSQQDCLLCHNPNANFILGVKTRQLNGLMRYASGVTDNQLRTLSHIGLLNPSVPESSIGSLARLVPVTDTSASAETRLRSYVDANCAQCHRPNGAQTGWDARFDTPLDAQGIINGSVVNDLGIAGAKILVPGDPARSLLYVRMSATGSTAMPPLGRNTADSQAAALVSSYISSLGPPPPPGTGSSGVPGHLINVAGRAVAGTDSQTLITGFVIAGSGTKRILLRGVGPTLVPLGVPDAMGDPSLQIVKLDGSVIASNDNWNTAANASDVAAMSQALGAYPLPSGSRDSAMLMTIPAGVYTAQVKGVAGSTGVALAEIYDASPDAATALASPIVNLSIRTQVGSGAGVLIAGFVIGGDLPARLLIRGVGPGLTQFGVGGILADPQIKVFNASGSVLAQNDNWSDSDAANISSVGQAVGAFSLASGSRDAALIITLPPGAYTAQLSGANGGTGVGLVELYVVP